MSVENVTIPRKVWENVLHDLDFLKKTVAPLARGYKPKQWMDESEVMETLKIGKSRLKQLRQSGAIRIQKPVNGNATEYWRKDIEDYKAGDIIIPTKKKATAVTAAIS
jgi:DNA relaxase NicK